MQKEVNSSTKKQQIKAEIKDLICKLDDPQETKRTDALKKLVKIGKPAVMPLIKSLHYKAARELKSTALIKIGKPAARPLVETINKGDFRLKVYILKQIGIPAVKALKKVLQDTQVSKDVHRRAWFVLRFYFIRQD